MLQFTILVAVSQQISAVMYVETPARASIKAVSSVMEVAALTSLGELRSSASSPAKTQPNPPRSPQASRKTLRGRSVSSTRDNWDGSLRSNSSTLSSTKSDASMRSEVSETSPRISINTARPGRSSEAKAEAGTGERMVSIKCQRLRPDKTYEEVDIEVPEAVYNTMSNNKPGGGQTGDRGRIAGLGRQIKCLFSKTEQ